MKIYTAKDIMDIMQISESSAYKLIRQMNEELQAQGYLTFRGRVPQAYFEKRFYGGGAA